MTIREEGHAVLGRLEHGEAEMAAVVGELERAMVAQERAEIAWQRHRLEVVVPLASPDSGRPVAADAREDKARLKYFELWADATSTVGVVAVLRARLRFLEQRQSSQQTRVGFIRAEMEMQR